MDLGPEDAAAWRTRDARSVLRPWSDAEPLVIQHASGSSITDVAGRTYLDFTAGYFVNAVGHSHPQVVAAAIEQLRAVAQVSGKHATPSSIRLAERLCALAPVRSGRVFYSTGGAEANEHALRMVRQHTGCSTVATLQNGFHGLTLGALELAGNTDYRATSGCGDDGRAVVLPNAYCYRCPFGPPDGCRTRCLDGVAAQLDAGPPVAALIAEPIQGAGGLAPPAAWWERLDAIRRERGILLVLDEVQSGLGRTGRMFAAEHFGLEADVVVAGKGLSGGVGSLAATIASPLVAERFASGTTPTSAGNAVSAAAGLALIDVLETEGLVARAAVAGGVTVDALRGLDDPFIGDIRMRGLLGGVELVCDADTRAPLPPAEAARVVAWLRDAGVLVTRSGPLGNVIRLQPPLVVTDDELLVAVAALGHALRRLRQGAR